MIQRVTKKIREAPVALSGSDEATTEGQLHWLHLWGILHEKKKERIRKKTLKKPQSWREMVIPLCLGTITVKTQTSNEL